MRDNNADDGVLQYITDRLRDYGNAPTPEQNRAIMEEVAEYLRRSAALRDATEEDAAPWIAEHRRHCEIGDCKHQPLYAHGTLRWCGLCSAVAFGGAKTAVEALVIALGKGMVIK
jgi:hypothetical protein